MDTHMGFQFHGWTACDFWDFLDQMIHDRSYDIEHIDEYVNHAVSETVTAIAKKTSLINTYIFNIATVLIL